MLATLAFGAGETGFEFLEAHKTAYSQARNGVVALSKNPITGIFSNPASLAYINNKNFASVNFALQFVDSKNFSALYGHSINKSQKFGIGLAVNGYGEMKETTEDDPYGTGKTFSAQEFLIQGTYSHTIIDRLILAATPSFIYQKYYNYSAYALAINLGAIYDLGKYRVALVGKNLGGQLKTLLDNDEKDPLPYTASVAFGNNIKNRFSWEFDLTKIYKQDITFGFSSEYHINRMFSFLNGVTITSEHISYIFNRDEDEEFFFDESRLISLGLSFNHKNLGLIFGIGFAGMNFGPNTSIGLDYSF